MILNAFLFISILVSFAMGKECINHYDGNSDNKLYFSSLVDLNLLNLPNQELSYLQSRSNIPNLEFEAIRRLKQKNRNIEKLPANKIIQELNKITFAMLNEYQPKDSTDNRFDGLDINYTGKILNSFNQHPIASFSAADRKYSRTDTEIGYCFGRAMYFHQLLLRLGVDENSIKKIWAVGPMSAGSITWQFHVAIAVRGLSGEWFVIDPVYSSPNPGKSKLPSPEEWYQSFLPQNKNKDLRIYITEPEKFGVSAPKYNVTDLGLRLSSKQDFYRGFFKDLQAWFRSMNDDKKLADFLGLSELPVKPFAEQAKLKQAEQERLKQEAEEREQRLKQAYGIDL